MTLSKGTMISIEKVQRWDQKRTGSRKKSTSPQRIATSNSQDSHAATKTLRSSSHGQNCEWNKIGWPSSPREWRGRESGRKARASSWFISREKQSSTLKRQVFHGFNISTVRKSNLGSQQSGGASTGWEPPLQESQHPKRVSSITVLWV